MAGICYGDAGSFGLDADVYGCYCYYRMIVNGYASVAVGYWYYRFVEVVVGCGGADDVESDLAMISYPVQRSQMELECGGVVGGYLMKAEFVSRLWQIVV